jgi:hypothetical protein
MSKKKKHPALAVSVGFLLTFLFSNVLLFFMAYSNGLTTIVKNN